MWASDHEIQPSMANYELLFTSKFEDLYDTNSTKPPWLLVPNVSAVILLILTLGA